MDCFVYVLGSGTKARPITYVGWTNDIVRRLAKHNTGKGARTTRGREWVLLHSEWFPTRREAMSREWFLKRDRKLRKKLAVTIEDKRKPRRAKRRTKSGTKRRAKTVTKTTRRA